MTQPLWVPSESRIASANMTRFMHEVNSRYAKRFTGYDELQQWSIANREDFWSIMWDFGGIVASQKGERILLHGERMPGSIWFPDASLNFAQNLLRYQDDRTALIFRGEDGRRDAMTHADLYRRVAQLASAMRNAGLFKGDRVGGFMPNVVETVIAMLAATSIGAVWSSCSPDFGVNGVVDRFGQITPKLLFTTDGYTYNGKTFDSLAKIAAIFERVPSVEHTVVVPFLAARPDLSALKNAALIADFVDPAATQLDVRAGAVQSPRLHHVFVRHHGDSQVHRTRRGGHADPAFERTDVAYRHRAGRHDRLLHHVRVDDVELAGERAGCGARVLLFDGSPFSPHPGALFDIAAEEKMTVFGTSAKYIASIEKAGVEPRETHDLSSLRTLCSTGSPLANESFQYVYREHQRGY